MINQFRGLVVYDFDRSLYTTGDIDDVVISTFLGYDSNKVRDILQEKNFGWNALMNHIAGEIYDLGFAQNDIMEALRKVQLENEIQLALEEINLFNYDQKILSDANVYFINEVLHGNGTCKDYFSEIISNPAHFDITGRLVISPYHSSHPCIRCPINMCKGDVIQKWLNDYKKIVYVGDGLNDFCPTASLKSTDVVLARKDFPLHCAIKESPISAQVHVWETASELYLAIKMIMNENTL